MILAVCLLVRLRHLHGALHKIKAVKHSRIYARGISGKPEYSGILPLYPLYIYAVFANERIQHCNFVLGGAGTEYYHHNGCPPEI